MAAPRDQNRVRPLSEYGWHFFHESANLVGVSPFVDVSALREWVLEAVAGLERAQRRLHTQASQTPEGARSLFEAAETMRDILERHQSYLRVLPRSMCIDVTAFHPDGLDGLVNYTPTQLLRCGDEALRGFELPAYGYLPNASMWRRALQEARDALAAALAGSRETPCPAVSAALLTAERRFLDRYGVAKRLIRGLLSALGHVEEYPRYFLDLRAQQSGSPAKPEVPVEPAA